MAKNNKINSALNKYIKIIQPYASFIYIPEDTLVFGFDKATVEYDTSWSLLVSKSKNVIQCFYNQLLPFRVTGFVNYIDDSTKLLYHEGFTFVIDEKKWDSIINLSGINAYNVKDSMRYGGCLHCPRYTAYYDSKFITNSKLDLGFLIKLSNLLKDQIINNLFEMKRHPQITFQK